MPMYNAQRFLAQAIESILSQTYQDFELIIVDDASTDRSWEIARNYALLSPQKVRTVRLPKTLNGSGDPATNVGVRLAKGAYIAKMDADDVAHPLRLEKQVAFLNEHPDVFLVGTQALVINENEEVLGRKNNPLSHKAIYQNFFFYNCLNHPSVMFRNEKKGKDFYEIRFPYFNEYWTFFKHMKEGKRFANLPDYLLSYRIHGRNESFSDIKRKFLTTSSIRKAFITELGYRPGILRLFMVIFQTLFVFCIPTKMLLTTYLLSRRILPVQSVLTAKRIYAAFF